MGWAAFVAAQRPSIMQQERSKYFYWALWTLLALTLGGVVAAKPVYRWYRHRHALQLVAEVDATDFPKRDWDAVGRKLRLAMGFDSEAPEVLRLAARYLTVGEREEALQYYGKLVSTGKATTADQIDFARVALRHDRADITRAQVREILSRDPLHLPASLLGVEALERLGLVQEATRMAEATLQAHPTSDDATLRLGLLMAAESEESRRAEGRRLLWGLALNPSTLGIRAAERLASEPTLTRPETTILVKSMELATNRTLPQDLMLYDLRFRIVPESEQGALRSLVIQRLGTTPTVMERVAVADWLLGHGAPERVREVLDESLTRESGIVTERWLQALASSGKWTEVNTLVEDATVVIPAPLRHCFRAILQQREGNTNAVVSHLTQAVNALREKEDPNPVYVVARYAEQLQQPRLAAAAYDKLLPFPNHAPRAAREILRILTRTDDVQQVLVTLRRLLEFQPGNLEIADSLSWGELLTRQRVSENAIANQERRAKHPKSDRFRLTAVLALLRQNNPEAALALLESRYTDKSSMPPRARLLHIAALGNSGQRLAAQHLAATLDPTGFKSEELELIRPWREESNR